MRRVVVLVVLCWIGVARAQTGPADLDPLARGKQLYNLAIGFYADADYVAAAILFVQAQKAFRTVADDPDALELQRQAIFFEVSAQSLANHPVEAHDALVRYRALASSMQTCGVLHGKPVEVRCLPPDEIERNLRGFEARIGTLVLRGIPNQAITFLDTRAVELVSGRGAKASTTLRVTAGEHVLDVRAPKHKPFVRTIRVEAASTLDYVVVLEPSDEPARVRFVASVEAATVFVDGARRGVTPLELTLPPGHHSYRIAAKAHLAKTARFEAVPGERVLVDASLVARRAPLGLRIDPYFVGAFYLRHDTPFETSSAGVGMHVFSDWTRFGGLRIGFGIEYNARQLAQSAVGLVFTWCPDKTASAGAAFCPLTVDTQWAFGGEAPPKMETAPPAGRAMSSLELHAGNGFFRLAAGMGVVTYRNHVFTDTPDYKWLGALHVELAAGLDL